MRWAALLAAIAVFAGASACKRERAGKDEKRVGNPRAPLTRCWPEYGRRLCKGGDQIACGWVSALESTPDDDALRALIPALNGKTLLDGEPPAPATPLEYTFEASPPHQIDFPIDWSVDPFKKRSWRSGLQNLSWLPGTYREATDLDVPAYVIVDWADQALARDAELEWTWNDAALARRLQRVSAFLDRYLVARSEVNRRVIHAAVRIIASHLRAMSIPICYSASNHGMMQDLQLVRYARVLPGLPDGEDLLDRARVRMVEHVHASVNDEGIHVENSPDYHVMYLRLIYEAIDAFAGIGAAVPPELPATRDAMLEALVYHLQPNQTLAQFGDTANGGPQATRSAIEVARRQGSTAPGLEHLEWIVSDGAAGRAPEILQRVYPAGGYAMFRERWSGRDDVMAHIKYGRLSNVHEHADETSFELYGRGTELVVDTGKYSYQYDDPLVIHQYDARAHNLLIVDDAPFDEERTGRIVASGDGWVRGEHTGYASRGVSVSRTFGYARPDAFVVVDRATAAAPHAYAQHFHLHPVLADVQVVDDRTVVAKGANGAALTLTAGEPPLRIDVVRGQHDATGVQGWYYEGWEGAVPTADVIFVYGDRPGPEVSFPVVLTVSSTPATDVRISDAGVSWAHADEPRSMTFSDP